MTWLLPAPVDWRQRLRAALLEADRPGATRGLPLDGSPSRWFALALELLQSLPLPEPGSLWSPAYLRDHWQRTGVALYPHQLETARRALCQMGGRAILADEVGLGKTFEAGLILHELLLRRLVRRALILVPAGLMWQWYRELREKFDLPVELQASLRDWVRVPLLIASLDTAKRSPHREQVAARPYDLVIVDEAHRLKNHRTSAFQLLAGLRSRFLLLLTATPVHNTLRELHALCYLVAPARVGPLADFCRRYGARGRQVTDPAALRELVRGLVVRHRRRDTPIPFTPRRVHTCPVEPGPDERRFYDALDRLAPGRHRGGRPGPTSPGVPLSPLVWLTLKREACSSPQAACATLRHLAARWDWPVLADLIHLGEALTDWAKARAVEQLVRELGDEEHVLVFTESVATQQALARRLAQLGRPVVLFHGDLTPMQREWAQAVFRARAPIMVSTDAGAEGLNLQFCRHLVNVDLPWNPMRIEQRIGRLHRLGQTREVHIWNVYARGTVEEYVLHLLHDKLDLFRSVVGDLEAILEPLGGPRAFEEALTRTLAGQTDGSLHPVEQALEELVRQWQRAIRRYQTRMRLQGQLLDET